jgi:hypothetical protein
MISLAAHDDIEVHRPTLQMLAKRRLLSVWRLRGCRPQRVPLRAVPWGEYEVSLKCWNDTYARALLIRGGL